MPSVQFTSCTYTVRGCLVPDTPANPGSYDPDYGQWDFGKLSALREIALAVEAGYEYYYMGTFALS